MKAVVLAFVLIFGSLSFATKKIIEYQFGNQITGSIFIVNSDGTMTHSERSCCPPHTDQIAEPPLDHQTVEKLIHLISAASNAPQAHLGAGESGMGSPSGTLTGYNSKGEAFNIRKIELGNGDGSPQPVTYSSAPEARQIESFVFARVQNKMEH